MSFKLSVTNAEGTRDISGLVQSVTWSGEYTQCVRTLEFGILSSPIDKNIPAVNCNLGDGVLFEADDNPLFSGYVFSRQKSTNSSIIDITCYDRGIYIKRNKGVYKFSGITPEDITRQICRDFGIETGEIAKTGIKITRNFIGVTLYRIIQTAYTLAAEKTGEKYYIRFKNDKLSVAVNTEINFQTQPTQEAESSIRNQASNRT